MTPKLVTAAGKIVRAINAIGGTAAIWLSPKGTSLEWEDFFPKAIGQRRRVGLYVAPVSLVDVLEDIESSLDDMCVEVRPDTRTQPKPKKPPGPPRKKPIPSRRVIRKPKQEQTK